MLCVACPRVVWKGKVCVCCVCVYLCRESVKLLKQWDKLLAMGESKSEYGYSSCSFYPFNFSVGLKMFLNKCFISTCHHSPRPHKNKTKHCGHSWAFFPCHTTTHHTGSLSAPLGNHPVLRSHFFARSGTTSLIQAAVFSNCLLSNWASCFHLVIGQSFIHVSK